MTGRRRRESRGTVTWLATGACAIGIASCFLLWRVATLSLPWRRGPLDRPEREGPRQRNGFRIEADLRVARLIVERTVERQRVLAAERRLRLRRPIQLDVLQQRERLLVDRHALVERSEEVDL